MKERDSLQVSAFDAKTHLSQLLREAERGRSVTITRNGKAVARLVPAPGASPSTAEQLIESFRDIRRAAGKPVRVKQWIREGRKR
jgi:prevent-host-death family protein